MKKPRIPFWSWLVLCAGLVAAVPAPAALPAAADGQPLPSLAPMLERVTPAVVNIATEGHVEMRLNPLFNDPFFRRFFNVPDQPLRRKTQSLGSGVIVDAARGLVLTNNHVIANADEITVNLRDGREFKAELVGSDPDTDVAVVRIEADALTALPFADSDRLRVGDFVVAIGNPFGLGQTVTSGIISALARSGLGLDYEDFIQTDASINPGNSGGALVNLAGELVGINTAIFSRSGGNIGIGFAIPINMAREVMEQLVAFGEVRRGFLGLKFQDLDPELALAFGLEQKEGALVTGVLPDSPAAQAGLAAGDVITHFNGRRVESGGALRTQIGLTRTGRKVEIAYLRQGKPRKTTVEVAAREEAAASGKAYRNPRLAGLTVGEIPSDAPFYGRLQGVVVFDIAPDSPAYAAGLRRGDVISSVNRVPTPSVPAFVEVVNGLQGQLLLSVHRGNEAAYLVIK